MSTPRPLRVVISILVLVAVAAAACGDDDGDSTTDSVDGPQPVVMDTDGSVEGAMAILYFLQEPSVSVEAITVSGTGLVSCRKGVDQVLGLVALADAGDVPVACGSTEPLAGDNSFPTPFRVVADSLGGVRLPAESEPSELTADELLAEVITAADEPVRIYADGPLTNIATLFDRSPDIENVAGITLMGGALDVPGTTFDNPDAEWNIWVDPVAAERVLAAGHPVTVVPLDATNDVPLTPMHVLELESYDATPIAETVNDLMGSIRGAEQGFVYFWDQLTAAVMIDESLVTFEDRTVSVTTEGDPSAVGTMLDDPDGHAVRVAVGADREAFEATFFTTLMGEPVTPVDLSPDVTVTFDGEEWTHDFPPELPLGPLVIAFENSSELEAFVPILWLTGDATIEDLEAWESIEQPPFTELAGFVFAEPGESASSVSDIIHEGTKIVGGVVVEPFSFETVTTFEVGPSPD